MAQRGNLSSKQIWIWNICNNEVPKWLLMESFGPTLEGDWRGISLTEQSDKRKITTVNIILNNFDNGTHY